MSDFTFTCIFDHPVPTGDTFCVVCRKNGRSGILHAQTMDGQSNVELRQEARASYEEDEPIVLQEDNGDAD